MKIPNGMQKMKIELTIYDEYVSDMENKVLFWLVRDYYIFYSKEKKESDNPSFAYTVFKFYCYPKDEIPLTYQLGCFSQAILVFFDEKYLTTNLHRVPDGFPKCIEVTEFE